MEIREHQEAIQEAAHGHGNKRVALLIAILAALLALTEMRGKGTQLESLAANIEAANLWSFFQSTRRIRLSGSAHVKGMLP